MSSTTRGAARGAAAEEAPVVSDAAADAGGVQRVPRVVDVANASTPEFVPSQGQGQGLPKTDAMYSAGRTKFREFIKSRPVEDRIEAYWFNFLDGDGKIRDGTFRMFAEWLDEQPKMSESAFKTAALKWTQHNLVLQHRARYLPTSHLGAYVTTLPGVATIWEKYKVGRASQVRVEFVDLQQQTESAITADQMISSMRLLMSDAPLTCSSSDGTTVTPLMKANARFEMRASHQQSGRSDDMRSETLAFSFAKTHPLLGPEGEGKSLTVFSNHTSEPGESQHEWPRRVRRQHPPQQPTLVRHRREGIHVCAPILPLGRDAARLPGLQGPVHATCFEGHEQLQGRGTLQHFPPVLQRGLRGDGCQMLQETPSGSGPGPTRELRPASKKVRGRAASGP